MVIVVRSRIAAKSNELRLRREALRQAHDVHAGDLREDEVCAADVALERCVVFVVAFDLPRIGYSIPLIHTERDSPRCGHNCRASAIRCSPTSRASILSSSFHRQTFCSPSWTYHYRYPQARRILHRPCRCRHTRRSPRIQWRPRWDTRHRSSSCSPPTWGRD